MKINYIDNLNMYSENIIKKIIYKYGINTFKLDTYTKKPKLTKEEITQVFQILIFLFDIILMVENIKD